MPIKEEYTVNEVASILQTNPETVRKWIKEGKLSAIPGNSKKEGMRITEADIESFLADHPKYTKAAYISAAAAIITGGIFFPASIIFSAQMNAKKIDAALANAKIKSSDMIRLLEEELSQEEQYISERIKQKESLEKEIHASQKRITNIEQMISDLQEPQESGKKSNTAKRSSLTVGGASRSEKERLGRVHKKKEKPQQSGIRISEIDLQCNDIMWFAIDANGCIIAFTSGGEGNVPEFICRSKVETEKLEEYFKTLSTGFASSKLLINKDDSPLAEDAESLSQKGLYCFDVCSDFDFKYGYYKISYPDKALHLSDLPSDIQKILADHKIDIDVSITDRIMVNNAY